MNRRLNPSTLLLAALFALTACDRGAEPASSARTASAPVASPLANVPLTRLDGSPVTLGEWQGKIIVANYWATWCPPCRAEMPEFSALHTAYRAQGVQFLGISLDEAAAVSKFSAEAPVTYPLLIAPLNAIDATVALGNQAQALPFTVILDRSGALVASKLGRFSTVELETQLKKLL